MEKPTQEPDALVDLRTHLTVATLAVEQLRRKHADSEDVQRLCVYADTATQQMRDDIVGIEAIVSQPGHSAASQVDERRTPAAPALEPRTNPRE